MTVAAAPASSQVPAGENRGPGLLDKGLLAMLLIVPSAQVVLLRAGGIKGFCAYAVFVVAALWIGPDRLYAWLRAHLSRRAASVSLLALIPIFAASFAIVYPLAHSGRFGAGGDRVDALDIGAHALLHLEDPYIQKTYLGMPPSALPGALLFAAPFYTLGSSGWQDVLWLAVILWILWKLTEDPHAMLTGMLLLLFLCPEFFHSMAVGDDIIAQSGFIMAFPLLAGALAGKRAGVGFGGYAAAVGMGMALASRANIVFLAPLFLVYLAGCAGWSRAIRLAVVAAATAALLVLPFWMRHPHDFPPFVQGANKLQRFGGAWVLPSMVFVDAVLMLLLCRDLWRRRSAAGVSNAQEIRLLTYATLILALPIGTQALLQATVGHSLDLALFWLSRYTPILTIWMVMAFTLRRWRGSPGWLA